MSLKTAWRRWRLKVHDVLEVGGEAHPVGRVVNIFLVILIIANGLAFTKLLYTRLLHPVR
jgi:voltage-gated potassium channel